MIIEEIQCYPHVFFGSNSFGSKVNLIRNIKYLEVAGVDTTLTSKFSMKTIENTTEELFKVLLEINVF